MVGGGEAIAFFLIMCMRVIEAKGSTKLAWNHCSGSRMKNFQAVITQVRKQRVSTTVLVRQLIEQ
jgi:hypothetical protein